MTLRDMLNRIQSRVDDDVYWNDSRLTGIINHIKDKMSQEMRVVRKQQYEFDSVEGQQYYQVPDRYVIHHYLYYNSTYNTEIVMKDSPRDVYGPSSDPTLEGNPTMGFIWGVSGRRQLCIYPTFSEDGVELTWWFYGWPEDLAVDNDEPDFPIEWHPSLVDGAINQTKVDDKEMSVGDALILWKNEVQTIRGLATTRELLSAGEKAWGSVESHFPRIQESGPETLVIPSSATVRW